MLEQVANISMAAAQSTESFSFFMIIYGLLLGLAVTELFTGISPFLREEPLHLRKIGLLVPLLVVIVLVEIISTFIDAWDQYKKIYIELDDLFLPILVAIGYFVVAAISLPRGEVGGIQLDSYFLERKRRIIGILIALNIAVIVSDWAVAGSALTRGEYENLFVWLLGNFWLLSAYVALYFVDSHKGTAVPVCGALMIATILFYVSYYIQDPTCLFSERDRSDRFVCQLSVGVQTAVAPALSPSPRQ